MNGADIRFVHLGITINHLKSSISVFGFWIAFLWHHHRNRNAGRAVDRPVRYKAQRAGSRTLSGFCTVRDHMFRYRCKIVLCDFRVGLL